MKKFIVIICICIIVLVYFVYSRITAKITFYTANPIIYAIEVGTPGVKSAYTKDKNKIDETIKYLNSITYYKWPSLEVPNESHDAYAYILDKDGKIIEKIEYFGDVVLYKDKRYGLFPLTYNRIEKLCNKLNGK